MNFKKFLKKIITLLKAKYSFEKIKETEIVIYDATGSKIFSELLHNRKYFILHTRFEKINIKIFLRSLIKYGFKWRVINYIELFLKYLNPKYVITFIDNDVKFWQLKNKLNDIQTCFIQNGFRDKYTDIFRNKKSNTDKFKVDKMLVFNDNIASQYKKFIKGETIVTGSFYNNKFERSKKKDNNLLFISSWDDDYSNLENYDQYLLFHKIDFLAFKLVSQFAEKYKFKLKVLGRKLNHIEEEKFYKNLNKNFIFLKRKNDRKFAYQAVDESQLTIGIDSTLAYESLSRGNKTFLISCRNNFVGGESYKFGWPKKFSEFGIFWSNNFNKERIMKSLKKLIELDKISFNYELQFVKNEILYYNENNTIIKNFFKKNFR